MELFHLSYVVTWTNRDEPKRGDVGCFDTETKAKAWVCAREQKDLSWAILGNGDKRAFTMVSKTCELAPGTLLEIQACTVYMIRRFVLNEPRAAAT